jgi:hypothetical protein
MLRIAPARAENIGGYPIHCEAVGWDRLSLLPPKADQTWACEEVVPKVAVGCSRNSRDFGIPLYCR